MNNFHGFLELTRNNFVTKLFKEGVLTTKLLLIGALGILLLLAGGLFDFQPSSLKNNNENKLPQQVKAVETNKTYEETVETKLANLLSQVRGAGTVSVNILLERSGTIEHAKNITKETRTIQEKDNSNGTRTTTETKESEQVLVGKENGIDRPVMVSETKPVIKGVLVVAEGAADSVIKANLTKAVETVLGIPSYKITVLPYRK